MLRLCLVVFLAVSVYCVDHRCVAAASHHSRTYNIGNAAEPSQRCGYHAHSTVLGAKCAQKCRSPLQGSCRKGCPGRCQCDQGYVKNRSGVCTLGRKMQSLSRQPNRGSDGVHLFAKGRRARRSPDPLRPPILGHRGIPHRTRAPVRLGLPHRVPPPVHLKRLPLRRTPLLPILHLR